MSHFWGNSPVYYSSIEKPITVSNHITYIDVISVLNSLNSFFPEDCCDLFDELVDKADIECSITNVFEILHEELERVEKEAHNGDDDDHWYSGDDSVWESIRSTVDDITEKFKEAIKNKLKFIDFYSNKLFVSQKLNEEELELIHNFIYDFIDYLQETEEFEEIASDFSDNYMQEAYDDEIEVFFENYISKLNVSSIFKEFSKENLEDKTKIAFSKCNFIKILKEYFLNKGLVNFALFYELGFYNDEFKYKEFTFSDDLETLFIQLKKMNELKGS